MLLVPSKLARSNAALAVSAYRADLARCPARSGFGGGREAATVGRRVYVGNLSFDTTWQARDEGLRAMGAAGQLGSYVAGVGEERSAARITAGLAGRAGRMTTRQVGRVTRLSATVTCRLHLVNRS